MKIKKSPKKFNVNNFIKAVKDCDIQPPTEHWETVFKSKKGVKIKDDKISIFLKELEKLWRKYPRERFFQCLFNYSRLGTRAGIGYVQDPFHYSDEDILGDIKLNNK